MKLSVKIVAERHHINPQYYENKGISFLKRWILESDHNFPSLLLTLYQEHIMMMFVIFRLVTKSWEENVTYTVI